MLIQRLIPMISWTFGGAYSVARILVAGIEAQVKLIKSNLDGIILWEKKYLSYSRKQGKTASDEALGAKIRDEAIGIL